MSTEQEETPPQEVTTEEPKAEEPKAEEPKAEEPKAEEPKAEEPKAEEPKAEEPKAEEPKAEEPKAEEPKAEEPKAEEPKAEEPKAEEPKAEEPKAEEPKAEERKGQRRGRKQNTTVLCVATKPHTNLILGRSEFLYPVTGCEKATTRLHYQCLATSRLVTMTHVYHLLLICSRQVTSLGTHCVFQPTYFFSSTLSATRKYLRLGEQTTKQRSVVSGGQLVVASGLGSDTSMQTL